MNNDDKLSFKGNLPDILAFCIVASDWLRAKRRRFPQINTDIDSEDMMIDNTTFYLGRSLIGLGGAPMDYGFCYYTLFMGETAFLWNYNVEYLEE